MNLEDLNNCSKYIESLKSVPKSEQIPWLMTLDDVLLWDMWRCDVKEALIALFKKNHQKVVVKTYVRTHERFQLSLLEVQDAFSELMEKILHGKYKDIAIKKNFEAFAIYHTIFLIRSKAKKKAKNPVIGLEKVAFLNHSFEPFIRTEKSIDFRLVLDCIPLISNELYRNLIYLIFILGYNSKDLIPFFGKAELAYDKRYRALNAFKKILKKEGLWDELR